jgi:hypothetical protein
MSGSNRNERLASVAKYGGAVIALLVFVIMAWQMSAQIAKNRTYAERNTYHYAKVTHDEIESTCVNGPSAAIANCVEQIVKASEETKRAEYDLQAQRDMSEWSFWALVVGGLGIVFTAVGIWFVRENLIEMQRQRAISESAVEAARDANTVARDIGRVQVRAYISVKYAEMLVCKEGRPAEVRVWYENTGMTPAKNITTNVGVTLVSTSFERFPNPFGSENLSSSGDLGAGHLEYAHRVTKEPLTTKDIESLATNKKTIVAAGEIEYSDVFGDEWRVDIAVADNIVSTTKKRMGIFKVSETKLDTSQKKKNRHYWGR